MSEWIEIGDPVLNGNRVENQLTMSGGLKRYFKYKLFYVEYDEEIRWNPSILNIPAVSCLVTFAWVAGAELRVGDLDKRFALSLKELYTEYEAMYPGVLGGRLSVKRAWENKPDGDGVALFFSGGLDSTYSLYELLDRSPRLIMVKGFDYYMDSPTDEVTWQRWKDEYAPFAERLGLILNFVETNSRAVLKEGAVDNVYRRSLKLPIWEAVRHSPLLIGLAAPLSVGRFDELVISASRTSESPTTLFPFATAPNTDEKIGWMGLHVTHFGLLHRYLKVAAIAEHVNAGEITLRCCYKRLPNKWNCSLCEKCARVMFFLLTAGADPNKCGFELTEDTFSVIRSGFERNTGWAARSRIHWKPWLNSLPDEVPDVLDLRDFVDWMKGFRSEGAALIG